jgi:hypothetical protein
VTDTDRRPSNRRPTVSAARVATDIPKRWSDTLGWVTIPDRECSTTGEFPADCDCAVHAPRTVERCEITGYDIDECGCPSHRDHPDL